MRTFCVNAQKKVITIGLKRATPIRLKVGMELPSNNIPLPFTIVLLQVKCTRDYIKKGATVCLFVCGNCMFEVDRDSRTHDTLAQRTARSRVKNPQ